jgi:hypothetical protein
MADSTTIGWILVAGTVLGLAPVAHPALIRIWNMPRADHVAAVAEHLWVWRALNAGFMLATIASAVGLLGLGTVLYGDDGWASAVVACAVAYTIGGVLWCAVLATRTRTTPLLATFDDEALSSRGLAILDAAVSGLFDFFVVLTGAALAALGVVLLIAGGLPIAVAVVTLVTGAGCLAWLGLTGDVIPAVLYLPTLLVGIALIAGWT